MAVLNAHVRPSVPSDGEALRRIWKAAFGDGDEYIDGWLGLMYSPGDAAVAEKDGEVVSSAYAAELGELFVPGAPLRPVSVVYALGTLPEYRSGGLGAAVTRFAADMCEKRGVCVISPAGPSLFGYYSACAGFSDYFYASRAEFPAPAPASGRVSRISAADYSALREELLSSRAHIVFSGRAMAYQEHLCAASGGGLFRIETGGSVCAAAAETEDGRAVVKELLAPAELRPAAASLAAEGCGASWAEVRFPADGGSAKPFSMIRGAFPVPSPLPWYGFAFD